MLVLSLLQVISSIIVIGAFCSTTFAHFSPTMPNVGSVMTPLPPTLTLYVRLQIAKTTLDDGERRPVLIQVLYSNAPPHITAVQTTKHIASGTTPKSVANGSTHNSRSPAHTSSESLSQSPPSLTLAGGPLSSDTTTSLVLDGPTAISSTGASITEGNISSGSKTETSIITSPTALPRTSGSVTLFGQIEMGILGAMVLQAIFWTEYF